MDEKQLAAITKLCDELGLDLEEVIENINDKETDFEVDNYRFIHKDVIDDIMCREMSDDAYILGCFNAWFIAENTDLSIDIVEVPQKADEFEAIGQHIIDNDFVEEMQASSVSYDGYGNHFAHYDNNEIEDLLDVCGYYVFRIN
jgi:hypothetical protein